MDSDEHWLAFLQPGQAQSMGFLHHQLTAGLPGAHLVGGQFAGEGWAWTRLRGTQAIPPARAAAITGRWSTGLDDGRNVSPANDGDASARVAITRGILSPIRGDGVAASSGPANCGQPWARVIRRDGRSACAAGCQWRDR